MLPICFCTLHFEIWKKNLRLRKLYLQEHVAREENGVKIKQGGRKGVFTPDEELELKNCIVTLA